MERKYHWYLFSFATENGFSRVSMGKNNQNVTESDIRAARKSSGSSDNSVPLSVSYLGYMTESDARATD